MGCSRFLVSFVFFAMAAACGAATWASLQYMGAIASGMVFVLVPMTAGCLAASLMYLCCISDKETVGDIEEGKLYQQ